MRTRVSRLSATSESQYTTRMSDGRYIVVSSKPMANGFIVTTHQDITEQRRSEAKIVHMALHDALTELAEPRAVQRAAGRMPWRAPSAGRSWPPICSTSTTSRTSTIRWGILRATSC